MNKPFRIGIVGCGRIAPRHVRACVVSDRFELTALVDPTVSRAEDLARRFAIRPRIGGHVTDALEFVDGVIIAVPNHLHCEVAITCLDEKVPVLIEKPLATTVAEGEQICQASQRNKTIAAVAYVTRFRESVRLMSDLVRSGYFGAVRRFAYQFGSRGGWSPLSAYNLDRRAAGGGVLVVTGTHFLDRMLSWFGVPDEVHLEDDALDGPEANAVATFNYRRGGCEFEGTARFSKTLKLPPGFVMDTERGCVLLADNAEEAIQFWPHDCESLAMTLRPASVSERLTASSDTFRLQLEDFADACLGKTEPMVSSRAALQSLELIEALYANRTFMRGDWYRAAEMEMLAR